MPFIPRLKSLGFSGIFYKRLLRAKAHVAKEDGTILATGSSIFLIQRPPLIPSLSPAGRGGG